MADAPMTPRAVADRLAAYLAWRRGILDNDAMPEPRQLGRDIERAVALLRTMPDTKDLSP